MMGFHFPSYSWDRTSPIIYAEVSVSTHNFSSLFGKADIVLWDIWTLTIFYFLFFYFSDFTFLFFYFLLKNDEEACDMQSHDRSHDVMS